MTFTSVITELAEIDSLPCAEIQATFRDGNADTHTAEGTLCMSRHVIRTFEDMVIIRFIVFDQTIEYLFHVRAYVWICVLIDAQCATGMLHKEVEKSCLW